jgi:predicted AAA+ superfamily ATPase
MVIFTRHIEPQIQKLLFHGKAILIFGPRQAGKTTLAKKLIQNYGKDGQYFNCEIAEVRNALVLGEPDRLKMLVANKKIVVLDEAQTVLNIGAILKVFLDTYPEIQIIATGSSSFDLANKINEPLTGRAFEFTLYPLSTKEVASAQSQGTLFDYLRTGMYPEVVAEPDRDIKKSILQNVATNYLYKDVFIFESIKSPLVFENLIKMLAYQIGNIVSVNELSSALGVSRSVVEKYLRLLEQSYIIKRVNAFSRNHRNEIKKAFKIYFLDLGIRNAVIDSFAPAEERGDRGNLFENFVFLELLKEHAAETFPPQMFFWRTKTKMEIDLILYKDEKIEAIEVKWKEESVSFKTFLKSYPNAKTRTVTIKNFA